MAEAGTTKSVGEKGTTSTPTHRRKPSDRPTPAGLTDDILKLQQSAGNRAVSQLLQASTGSLEDREPSTDSTVIEPSETSKANSRADLLSRAHAESGARLDESVRVPMERNFGVGLSGVRVHSGVSSQAAAEDLGARAYTIGSDIYLGRDAQHLSALQRSRLLAHEAVHTIQQGGQPVALQGKMAVSRPRDSAEVEADSISNSIMSQEARRSPSRALGLRDQLRGTPITRQTISRVAAPLIQRDLKDDYPVQEGNFRLDLTTESHPGAKSGMKGTIKFKANDKAPDSTNIKLLQVIKVEDLGTGKDYVWPGAQATRNKVSTVADPARAVTPGWHVDFNPAQAGATPRAKAADKDVSPYYRDYWANATSSQDGTKKGKAVTDASLWDYPGTNPAAGGPNARFSFETVAKATDTNHVYGTVMWGFTVSDTAKGKVENERAVGRWVTLRTTDEAIKKFDEHFRNKGSSTAPK